MSKVGDRFVHSFPSFYNLVPRMGEDRYIEMLVQHFSINPGIHGFTGKLPKTTLQCMVVIQSSVSMLWQRDFLLICCVYCFFSLFVSHLKFSTVFFIFFWFVNTYIPCKNRKGGGRWFGMAKNGILFICSYVHLFTFIFVWTFIYFSILCFDA